jgi:hypothetical protein
MKEQICNAVDQQGSMKSIMNIMPVAANTNICFESPIISNINRTTGKNSEGGSTLASFHVGPCKVVDVKFQTIHISSFL